MVRRAFLAFVASWLVVAAPRPAWGQGAARSSPPAPPPRFRFVPELDLPVMAISGVVASSWLFSHELAPAHCAPLCPREALNPLDRAVAGRYSPAWKLASDVSVGVVLVGAATTVIADQGARDGLVDLLVVAESTLVSSAASVTTQMAVRRPRPLVYGEQAPVRVRSDGNATLSFVSGHTATAFATTTALFWTLRARHPRSVGPWIALVTGALVSSFVGTSRILAGDHFPTDVAAGAALGAGIGTIVPALHRTDLRLETIADLGGNVAGLGLRFQPPH